MLRTIVLITLAPLCAAPGSADDSAAQTLARLFHDYDAWVIREFPSVARQRGDYTNATELDDNSIAAIERRHGERGRFLKRLHAIERPSLPAEDQLNYDLFEYMISEQLDGYRFRMFLAPITAREGPQQTVAQMHVRSRFDRYEDFAGYLTRLEGVPAQLENTLAKLKLGLAEGRTPPRVSIKGVPGQFSALVNGGLDALGKPFAQAGLPLSAEQLAELRRRFNEVSLPAVRTAMARLGRYVTDEYVPHARASIAAATLPDGSAYYAYMLRTMTTTDLTPREIHEMGLAEVTRIRAEMMRVIRSSDYLEKFPDDAALDTDALFARFVHYLRTDPRFYHKTPRELLRGYRDVCKRIDAELPKLFKTLPRLPYGVREIPAYIAPNQTTGYYSQGDIRNAEPGYFYANTYALDQRPTYEMIALAMHESVPGHHLQIALAQEMKGVPEFRKDWYLSAFGEGWALYAERLGLEVGLYADPYDNFGRLLYEMWRACRLVVDPGMHAFGWSRARAVKFMLDNTALSELNVNTEIDRYIAWPGQACAYKIGELKIRELRDRAEQALGDTFDLRAFHDAVLGAGTLPLTILERRIDAWIARHAAASNSR